MPANFSAGLQDSPDFSSSNSSSNTFIHTCLVFRTSSHLISAFCITNVLFIIPLSIVILHLCFQQRASRCHSDLFTYNMVVMWLLETVGSVLCFVGAFIPVIDLAYFGSRLFCLTWCVKLQFHTLTCVEQYLAVVHPVTFLALKSRNGKRISNMSICCSWLLLLSCMALLNVSSDIPIFIVVFIIMSFTVLIISFCSVSALCVLKRPGPGGAGRNKRAFLAILTIFTTLLFTMFCILMIDLLYMTLQMSDQSKCIILLLTPWFSLPCSVALPLLYLHRAGKLPGCSQSS